MRISECICNRIIMKKNIDFLTNLQEKLPLNTKPRARGLSWFGSRARFHALRCTSSDLHLKNKKKYIFMFRNIFYVLELPFWILTIWWQIRNQRPWKPSNINFHKNGKFFEISIRHIGSAILNFENLTTDSKSANSTTINYQVNMSYCLMEDDFFLKKVIFYLLIYY